MKLVCTQEILLVNLLILPTKIEEILFTLQIKFQKTITNLCSYTIDADWYIASYNVKNI